MGSIAKQFRSRSRRSAPGYKRTEKGSSIQSKLAWDVFKWAASLPIETAHLHERLDPSKMRSTPRNWRNELGKLLQVEPGRQVVYLTKERRIVSREERRRAPVAVFRAVVPVEWIGKQLLGRAYGSKSMELTNGQIVKSHPDSITVYKGRAVGPTESILEQDSAP